MALGRPKFYSQKRSKIGIHVDASLKARVMRTAKRRQTTISQAVADFLAEWVKDKPTPPTQP